MKPHNGHTRRLVAEVFYCAKDLAARVKVEPRTIRRWAIRFGVPATIDRPAALRWSETDAERLLERVAALRIARRSFPAYSGQARGEGGTTGGNHGR